MIDEREYLIGQQYNRELLFDIFRTHYAKKVQIRLEQPMLFNIPDRKMVYCPGYQKTESFVESADRYILSSSGL